MAGKPHQQFLLFAVVCLLALPNSQSKHPYQSDEIEVNDIEEADVDQEHESQSWESASEFEEQVQNQDSNTEDGFDILDSILESVKNVQQENEMDSELFSSEKILSIGEMKASLRKAGVSKTKLDNFLDRESLYEYYQQHKKTNKLSSESESESIFKIKENYIDKRNISELNKIRTDYKNKNDWRNKKKKIQNEINEVVLVGGQHTGIGWVASLLELNAPSWKLVEPFPRHALVPTISNINQINDQQEENNNNNTISSSSTPSQSIKQQQKKRERPLIEPNKVNSTLFLFVVQDPFTWVAAMHERSPRPSTSSSSLLPQQQQSKPIKTITNPKHHGYRKKKKKPTHKVSTRFSESLESYVKGQWTDLSHGSTPTTFPSISAMRTAKASALLRASEALDLRFGIIRMEDLIQDSEVTMRSVLTSLNIKAPWREHHWKERRPTEPEWFDLDHPDEPWHKPESYYLSHHKVLHQYTLKAAHHVLKHLDVKIEEQLGYLPHPLLDKNKDEVDAYFHSRTMGVRILSSLSKIATTCSAFAVAAPLGLLAVFLPLAAAYGSWMRFKNKAKDQEDQEQDEREQREQNEQRKKNEIHNVENRRTRNHDKNHHDTNNDEMIMMENTLNQSEVIHKNLRQRKSSLHSSSSNLPSYEHDVPISSSSLLTSSSSSSLSSYLPLDYLGLGLETSLPSLSSQNIKDDNDDDDDDDGKVNDFQNNNRIENNENNENNIMNNLDRMKLIERARNRLSKEYSKAEKIVKPILLDSLSSNGSKNKNKNRKNNVKIGDIDDDDDGDDDGDDGDYIPEDFEGGGYFGLYSDLDLNDRKK